MDPPRKKRRGPYLKNIIADPKSGRDNVENFETRKNSDMNEFKIAEVDN